MYTLDVVGTSTNVARFRNASLGTTCSLTSATGIIVCSSDERLKKNIATLDDPLSAVLQLNPISFNWVKDEDNLYKNFGFSAQQVEQVIPELVSVDESGYKSLAMTNMIPLLTGAIKEQQQEIDLLKSQLSSTTPVSSDNTGQITIAVSDSDPQFNTLRVSQAADFFGTITVRGEAGFESNVVFKDEVEFRGHLTVDSDTAGTAIIPAGATSTQVVFAKPYETMPKITATAKKPIPLGITGQSTSSFTVYLSEPASEEISLDWIALAVKGQVAGAEETAALGCMNTAAINYNSLATQDDGSCVIAGTVTPPPAIETPPAETSTTTPVTITPTTTTPIIIEMPVVEPVVEITSTTEAL
jgi:hypothetical protein